MLNSQKLQLSAPTNIRQPVKRSKQKNELLTMTQAAELRILNVDGLCCPRKLERWAREGVRNGAGEIVKLKTYKPTDKRYTTRRDVFRFIKERAKTADQPRSSRQHKPQVVEKEKGGSRSVRLRSDRPRASKAALSEIDAIRMRASSRKAA